MQTHYTILKVRESASADSIRRSYRRLVQKLHPDRNSSAGAQLHTQILNAAYALLSDHAQRIAYDRELAASRLNREVIAQDPVQPNPIVFSNNAVYATAFIAFLAALALARATQTQQQEYRETVAVAGGFGFLLWTSLMIAWQFVLVIQHKWRNRSSAR